MSKAWSAGSTPAWRKLRRLVLARDGYRCAVCGTVANSVDHIVPRSDGGRDTLDNLRALCKPHNDSRGAAPMDPEPLGRW